MIYQIATNRTEQGLLAGSGGLPADIRRKRLHLNEFHQGGPNQATTPNYAASYSVFSLRHPQAPHVDYHLHSHVDDMVRHCRYFVAGAEEQA